MGRDVVIDLAEAIRTHVHSGDTVALEGFSHLVPYAAGHEIIRQQLTGLTLCRTAPDVITDMMLAAGCLDRIVCSFFASGSAGSLHEVRRRVEKHDPVPVAIEEYSLHAMVLRYHAGAARLPFVPIHSFAGSDLPAVNPDIRLVTDPYTGRKIHVVPPLSPDVTIVHAQRADRAGNTQIWGVGGVQQEAVYAADRAIVVVEELVDDAVIRADPNRTLIPAHAVDAVCVVPTGAHPSFAQGYYDRDNLFYREWNAISKDPAALQQWLDDHVRGTGDHAGYLEAIGRERIAGLAVAPRLSGTVDYGRRRADGINGPGHGSADGGAVAGGGGTPGGGGAAGGGAAADNASGGTV